jgi:hypothetical protein
MLTNTAIAYAIGVVIVKTVGLILAQRAKSWLKRIDMQYDSRKLLGPDTPTAAVGRLGYVLHSLKLPSDQFLRMVMRTAIFSLLVSIAASAALVFFLMKAAFLVSLLWVLGGMCLLQALCKLVSILSVTTETTVQGATARTHTISTKTGLVLGFNPPGLVRMNFDLSTTRSKSQTWQHLYRSPLPI